MTDLFRDPLELDEDEGPPPERPEPGGCPYGCADGWVQVKPKYAEHMADQKHADRDTPAWRSAYAAHLNSSYPCRTHRPVQFFRWAGGHYANDHDPSSCVECAEAHGGQRRARKVAAMVAGNEQTEKVRRDIDG